MPGTPTETPTIHPYPQGVSDTPTARRKRLRRVNETCCPVCGGQLKWRCGANDGDRGTADCQDGRKVSRRWPATGEPCTWSGATTVRRPGGSVWVALDADPLEGAA